MWCRSQSVCALIDIFTSIFMQTCPPVCTISVRYSKGLFGSRLTVRVAWGVFPLLRLDLQLRKTCRNSYRPMSEPFVRSYLRRHLRIHAQVHLLVWIPAAKRPYVLRCYRRSRELYVASWRWSRQYLSGKLRMLHRLFKTTTESSRISRVCTDCK